MNFDKTIKENEFVRIEVMYLRGNNRGRRGIVVRFDNLTEIAPGIVQYSPMDGLSVFCEAMKRANAKTLKKWEEGIERIKDVLFDYWMQDNRDAIRTALGSI